MYGKWGFIDRNGAIVIEPGYGELTGVAETSNSFHEGLAMIEVNYQKGFIDKTGKIVWKIEAPAPPESESNLLHTSRSHAGPTVRRLEPRRKSPGVLFGRRRLDKDLESAPKRIDMERESYQPQSKPLIKKP